MVMTGRLLCNKRRLADGRAPALQFREPYESPAPDQFNELSTTENKLPKRMEYDAIQRWLGYEWYL
jgi:hypothetical protein